MVEDFSTKAEDARKLKEKEESRNFSQAASSMITHPDEDAKKKSMAEGIILELGNHTNEIDSIKQAITMIGEQMNQLTAAVNQMGQSIQGNPVVSTPNGQPPAQGLNMETIGMIGDLVEKGIGAYKSLKGDPQGPAPLIDQNFINERMKQSFLDDLDTGTSITNFIKDSLKKKVTKEVINTTFKDMGNTHESTHRPE